MSKVQKQLNSKFSKTRIIEIWAYAHVSIYANPSISQQDVTLVEQSHFLVHQYNLIDAWRERHPSKKFYIFHSHPHNMFSCIDYVFVCNISLPHVILASIIASLLFDDPLVSH